MHDPHQAFFDKLAEEWDLAFTSEDLERLNHLIEKINVRPGMDILDLGCGTGILFDLLRRKTGEKGTVTGVDFSLNMIRIAHRNFPFENVNVVDADVTMLPFPDKRFDLAVAFASFPHFRDQHRTLHEIHRVLKTGAKFFIIHLASSKEIGEHHKRIGGVVEQDRLPNAADFQNLFEHTKFKQVTIEDHPALFWASVTRAD